VLKARKQANQTQGKMYPTVSSFFFLHSGKQTAESHTSSKL